MTRRRWRRLAIALAGADRSHRVAPASPSARALLRDELRTHARTCLHPGDGRRRRRSGLGECVADANPYYSAETTRTAWHIISEFIAPLVLGRVVRSSARHLRRACARSAATTWPRRPSRWRRGISPPASKAGASRCWLRRARARTARTAIESGVSIGIQDSFEELVERVGVERAAGYAESRSRSSRDGTSRRLSGSARGSATCP